jgi:hypothetical protein
MQGHAARNSASLTVIVRVSPRSWLAASYQRLCVLFSPANDATACDGLPGEKGTAYHRIVSSLVTVHLHSAAKRAKA